MAEKNPKKANDGLTEMIRKIVIKYTTRHPVARPFFPPPGLSTLMKCSNSPVTAHPANPESSLGITEPLDTASTAISSTQTTLPENETASSSSKEPTSLSPELFETATPCKIIRKPATSPKSPLQLQLLEPFETVRPYAVDCISLLSPESPPSINPRRLEKSHGNHGSVVPPSSPQSPPQLHPRRFGKSHRIDATSLSPRIRSNLENRPISNFSEDELQVYMEIERLLENAEAQNQLNESVDLLQRMKFPEKLPDSPPPPYASNIENVEPSGSKEVPKLKKEKECIVCQRFERLSLQKDEVHLSWLRCKLYITSHMHDICTWEAVPAKSKSEFWLSLEYQRSRQNFDAQVKKYLDELDLSSLSTAVTLYIEKFMQVLYNHTPLEQVHSEEECEKQLKELQIEFENLLTTRTDVLRYLLYEQEEFRHSQCSTYKIAIEWIKECTQEISDGLREFEINLENLHLGRLIWSNNE